MYQVEFTEQAETDLSQLPKRIAQRILKKIQWLASHFDVITPETLTGQWQGFNKLRVGDYRVIYTVVEGKLQVIQVHFIRHRRDVYKIW